ncbi:MAG: His/Gly/Thr/Pro-type tRNA ligase C-terminal domain-containing protein, partial [Anaerolineae bacterium]
LALAARLRQAGINTEQYLEPDRLGKQISYADRRGIPYVAILGPDEQAADQVALKNLATGQQTSCSSEDAVEQLRAGDL